MVSGMAQARALKRPPINQAFSRCFGHYNFLIYLELTFPARVPIVISTAREMIPKLNRNRIEKVMTLFITGTTDSEKTLSLKQQLTRICHSADNYEWFKGTRALTVEAARRQLDEAFDNENATANL